MILGPHHGSLKFCTSTDICVFPLTGETCQIKRHSFIFHPRGVLLHFGIRGAPSRGSSDPTVADDVGN